MKTKVILRRFHDNGTLIALFPEIPGTGSPYTCESYMMIGQHGSSSTDLSYCSAPANPQDQDAREMLAHLEHEIGYGPLQVCQKFTRRHLETRRQELAQQIPGNADIQSTLNK